MYFDSFSAAIHSLFIVVLKTTFFIFYLKINKHAIETTRVDCKLLFFWEFVLSSHYQFLNIDIASWIDYNMADTIAGEELLSMHPDLLIGHQMLKYTTK